MRKRRHYTEDEKAASLAALAANGGNIARTSRQVGVPQATLGLWARGQRQRPPPDVCAQKKQDLADRMEEIARACLDAVTPQKIDEASAQQLLVSSGVAIDKMRLLRNEPTENIAVLVVVEEIVDAAPFDSSGNGHIRS